MDKFIRFISSMACQSFFLGMGLGSGIVTIMYDRFNNEVKKDAQSRSH